MMNKSDTRLRFYNIKATMVQLIVSMPMLQQIMLLSITTGMMRHSYHPHLMAILSPMYTGLRKQMTTHSTTRASLATLRNMKYTPQAHKSKHHRQGDA